MKVIKKDYKLDTLLERLKRQFYRDGKWIRNVYDLESNYSKLAQLEKLTPELIIEIVGRPIWDKLLCDECENDVDRLIQVGEELDYYSSTANICLRCLNEAIEKITENA